MILVNGDCLLLTTGFDLSWRQWRRHGRLVTPLLAQDIRMPDEQQLPPSIQWLKKNHAMPVRPDPYFRDDVGGSSRN
ncbi:MAG UNVERIFIED_CONTAM: hypothetical protein LVR18_48285 [Planctomycetaceae bacterium]|jgi:hypothetical protein